MRLLHAPRAEIGQALDIADAVDKHADEILFLGGQFFHGLVQHLLYALGQADDADGIMAAGFVFVGHEFGLAVAVR